MNITFSGEMIPLRYFVEFHDPIALFIEKSGWYYLRSVGQMPMEFKLVLASTTSPRCIKMKETTSAMIQLLLEKGMVIVDANELALAALSARSNNTLLQTNGFSSEVRRLAHDILFAALQMYNDETQITCSDSLIEPQTEFINELSHLSDPMRLKHLQTILFDCISHIKGVVDIILSYCFYFAPSIMQT
jgi:hypothetical protein